MQMVRRRGEGRRRGEEARRGELQARVTEGANISVRSQALYNVSLKLLRSVSGISFVDKRLEGHWQTRTLHFEISFPVKACGLHVGAAVFMQAGVGVQNERVSGESFVAFDANEVADAKIRPCARTPLPVAQPQNLSRVFYSVAFMTLTVLISLPENSCEKDEAEGQEDGGHALAHGALGDELYERHEEEPGVGCPVRGVNL